MENKNIKITIMHRLAGFLGAGYLHLVGATSFVQKWDHPQALDSRRRRLPVVYAFWHNNQVFLAYAHRKERVAIMVSRSQDGEYIAQVMKQMDLLAVRGSSSKGGDQAMREILDILQEGGQVGFSPDGPRGPLQTVQRGVIEAARLSGRPIVPTAVSARRRLVFNSWDRFFVPLPFNCLVVAHGKPIFIDSTMDIDVAKERVQASLNDVVERATQAQASVPSLMVMGVGQILFSLYTVLAPLLLPFWFPCVMMKYGWRRSFLSLKERVGWGEIPPGPSPLLWFHAASVGEWQALKPLLAEFKKKTGLSFLVTVSTPEARALIQREDPDLVVRLLPLDSPWILKHWIKKVNPHALMIVETELWPALLRLMDKKNVPVFVVNGRLSERSLRNWAWFRPLSRLIMGAVSHFFVRSELDAQRFACLGASKGRILNVGNMKNDNLEVLSYNERSRRRLEYRGESNSVVVIGGSTWAGEESVLLKILGQKLSSRVRLILAPRRPERFREVASLLIPLSYSWSSWSELKTTNKPWETDILLVDTLGDLKRLYGVSDIAFIGGSLVPHGGQNPLEPAPVPLAIVFGPSMDNFLDEAKELQEKGAATQVKGEADLISTVVQLIDEPERRRGMAEAAGRFVLEKKGSARKTMLALCDQMGL